MHGRLLMQSLSLFLQPKSVRRLLDTIIRELQIQAVLLQFISRQIFRQIYNFCSFVTMTTAWYHIGDGAGDMVMMVVMMVLRVCVCGIDESVMVVRFLMLVGQSRTFQNTFLCIEIT